MPIDRRRQVWFWWAATIMALLFALGSLAWVVADISAFRARSWVETWENLVLQSARKGVYYEPADKDWVSAQQAAALAVRLAPFSADYREALARVNASRYPMANDADERAMPFLEEAATQYRLAIRMRPTWPHTYVSLAHVLRRMGRLDEEYETSMRQALHYGPWEPAVLMRVVDINVDILPQLASSTRQLVLETLVRAQGWTSDAEGRRIPYGDQLWARVVARRKQMLVCSWLPMTDARIRERCTVPSK